MGDQRDGGIAWTDETWNPVRGCSTVSAGCKNCYAMRVAARFSGPGQPYEGLARMGDNGARWTGVTKLIPEHLADPLKWKRPRRIFVNSMSDLFHESLPDSAIRAVFGVMMASPQHTFQVLTKRPARMLEWFREFDKHAHQATPQEMCEAAAIEALPFGVCHMQADMHPWPLPNVWIGVSVEDQAAADERIPLLLQTPAAIRFLSCEPLLGPVQLGVNGLFFDYGLGFGPRINWVIAGGESGQGARPMHPDWVRSLRDQCVSAAVPFFFKQWGDWGDATTDDAMKRLGTEDRIFLPNGEVIGAGYRDGRKSNGMVEADWEQRPGAAWLSRIGKKSAGRLIDGRTWDQFPEP